MELNGKKINIHIERYAPDGNGYTTKVAEPLAPNVWAYSLQLSGKEIFAAAYRYDEVPFTLNCRNDTTTARCMEYGGVNYNANRIGKKARA